MDEHSYKENGIKSYKWAGIHNHQNEVAQNSQGTKEFIFSIINGGKILVEKVERYMNLRY